MFEELPPDDDTRFVASLFDTDIVASFLLEHPSLITCTAARTVTREKVIAEALPMLVNQGTFFLPIGEKCRALLFPKTNQISSRLILDCRVVNEMLTQFPMPAMPLPSIDEVIDAALKFHFMATRCRLNVLSISAATSLSALLQLRVANVRGPFSRVNVGVLPMGLSLTPSASQHFTNYICQVVEHRLQQQGREGFKVMAWVDNFLVFATTVEVASQSIETLRDVRGELHLVLKDDEKLTALGLFFDMQNGYVEATEEKRRAMNSALHRLVESQATNCDFMRWFGHMKYLNFAVAKNPMALYRGVMNMARNIARAETGRHAYPWKRSYSPKRWN